MRRDKVSNGSKNCREKRQEMGASMLGLVGRYDMGWFLSRLFREGFPEKIMSEQRPKKDEGIIRL